MWTLKNSYNKDRLLFLERRRGYPARRRTFLLAAAITGAALFFAWWILV